MESGFRELHSTDSTGDETIKEANDNDEIDGSDCTEKQYKAKANKVNIERKERDTELFPQFLTNRFKEISIQCIS